MDKVSSSQSCQYQPGPDRGRGLRCVRGRPFDVLREVQCPDRGLEDKDVRTSVGALGPLTTGT